MQEIKKFIRELVSKSFFWTKIVNPGDIVAPIVKAVENKEIPEVDPETISSPIVEAQRETTQAIREMPEVKIPEVDMGEITEKLEELRKVLLNKELSVKIGGTKLDTKPIVKAVENLRKNLPKMEKQEVIDYTLMFDEMMKIMENPFYRADFGRIEKLIRNLTTTEDMGIIAKWLEAILNKPYPEEPPFMFDEKGRLKVRVDRVGGGGGGGVDVVGLKNKTNSQVNPATEETLQDVKDALSNLDVTVNASDIEIGAVEIKDGITDSRAVVGADGLQVEVKKSALPSGAATSDRQAEFSIPEFDSMVINETDPDNVVITYKNGADTVATKTIAVVGAVTTITVT